MIDPTTGRPLPESAIQRVLFLGPAVHVYTIPPLTSTRGFSATSWTAPPNPTARQIFTARLRILETSLDSPASIKADILLEDPNSGDLFAAAPYTSPAVVQQANDSSRFFAIRVQGEGGMKATLGMGFEERGAALDFNIALGECRKVLGFDQAGGKAGPKGMEADSVNKTDFSLKDGEKITVQVGGKGRRGIANAGASEASQNDNAALFSIAPPPGPTAKGQNDSLAIAPPSAVDKKTAQDFGFDDGEFGEFQ